jgi:isopentenyl diphosphate isomerase/L-lactate dehydrogenase-like FMN-dependent dehydrogenase
LGADYVFIGRAFLYSMIDGEKGLNNCFDILTHELKNTMILCGTKSIK